ncbi:hypothetical protein GGF43_002608, partial [Coemansia sp. RSA 2618]
LSDLASFARWEALPPSLRRLVHRVDVPVRTRGVAKRAHAGGHPGAPARPAIPSASRATVPVAFPYALLSIIQDPANSAWIRWNLEGTEFQFCNWTQLIHELGARGMAATKKESVNKNFHDYGFERLTDSRRRIPSDDGLIWYKFRHVSFRRAQPDLVRRIVRKYRR